MTDELETQTGDDDEDQVAYPNPTEPEGTPEPTEPPEPGLLSESSPAEEPVEGDAPQAQVEPEPEESAGEAVEDPRATLDERVPNIEITESAAEAADEDEGVAEAADEDEVAEGPAAPNTPKVPWWPFLVLLATWLGVIAGAFLTLSYESTAAPLVQQETYAYVILAGLVLAILGPLLALVVWFVMWRRAGKGNRDGLLTVSLLRGAGVTLLGVLAWWGVIVALDALRLGLMG